MPNYKKPLVNTGGFLLLKLLAGMGFISKDCLEKGLIFINDYAIVRLLRSNTQKEKHEN